MSYNLSQHCEILSPSTDSRDEWLEARRRGIGASDLAGLLGLSPWTNPYRIYLSKTQPCPLSEIKKQDPRLWWGLLLEDDMAEMYEAETGDALDMPPGKVLRSRQWPWLLASLDRVRVVNGELLPVELKTSVWEGDWGEEGSDDIPLHYIVQAQGQMAVTGARVCEVAVFLNNDEFRRYTVKRNPLIIGNLVETARCFIAEHVEPLRPPEPTWTDARTQKIIARLHGVQVTKTLDWSQRPDLIERSREMARMTRDINAAIKRRDALKASLLMEMGDASFALLGEAGKLERRLIHRRGYEVKETEYVRFMPTVKGLDDVEDGNRGDPVADRQAAGHRAVATGPTQAPDA